MPLKKINSFFNYFNFRQFVESMRMTLLRGYTYIKANWRHIGHRHNWNIDYKNLSRKQLAILIISSIFLLFTILSFRIPSTKENIPVVRAEKRSFTIDVKSIGELEAARSTVISSSVRGDQGKIIHIVADGLNVREGDVLLKMDPTPFEEKIESLKIEIKEHEAHISALEQTLKWEINQAEHEQKTSLYETETAELELNKIVNGDGPLETSRLKSAMQKAWLKYEELNGYSDDLIDLEKQGFLNHVELRQAEKKLEEEKEAYEVARMQYESYTNHVYPMQVKKAETALKHSKIKQEDVAKTRGYKIGKAMAELEQVKQSIFDTHKQYRDAEKELAFTEIKAPAPGMVVHREDYRAGQKRKPRVGDVLVKNQPLIDLPDLDAMIVKTKVREVDLYKVAIGKKASIEVDAYPQLHFSGEVISIGVLAMSDFGRASEEKYFELRIALDKSDPRLRPGMTTRATVHAEQADQALTVPVYALFEERKKNYCYVSCFRGYEKRAVELGGSNEQWAQVKSGLEEGECVCLINPEAMKNE